MAAKKIKEGDVVYLKSGGPAMTVGSETQYNPVGQFKCHWFDDDEKEHALKVPPEALELVPTKLLKENHEKS